MQDVLDDGHDKDVAEDEEEDGVEVAEVVANQGEKQQPAKYLEDTVNENLDEELKLVVTVRVFFSSSSSTFHKNVVIRDNLNNT